MSHMSFFEKFGLIKFVAMSRFNCTSIVHRFDMSSEETSRNRGVSMSCCQQVSNCVSLCKIHNLPKKIYSFSIDGMAVQDMKEVIVYQFYIKPSGS